jgi:phosphoribosyl-AMP cyclohydrolase / phosphoribosyl-ATP pyrophosphohydrolase
MERKVGQLTATALESVRYDAQTGLVPVVVQDQATGAVLMLAYANREALKRTLGTGQAWFWSRSRGDYWHKGATSGNVQRVVEVRLDCDGDAVLYLVDPAGPACHTGEYSCFYQRVEHKGETAEETRTSHEAVTAWDDAVSPAETSHTSAVNGGEVTRAASSDNDATCLSEALDHLWTVLTDRWEHRPQGSYTTYLFTHGMDKVAKKVGEEAVEVAIAAKNAVQSEAGKAELAEESADLLYHLLALWKLAGLSPADVCHVLQSRER